jgi:hypothetical protein
MTFSLVVIGGQLLAAFIGALFPFVGNVVFLVSRTTVADPTPLGFTVTAGRRS